MCDLDLQTCDVWRERTVTAVKEHSCDTCRCRIQPGDNYLNHFSVLSRGDSPTVENMCQPCWLLREVFAAEHGRMNPSYFEQSLSSCIDDGEAKEDSREWRDLLAALFRRRRAARRESQVAA